MDRIKPYLKAMRINQWTKNAFIFAPLIFDGKLTHFPSFLRILIGTIIFSVLYSGIYVFNDIVDVEADRLHPRKKNRPIASGTISIRNARIFSIALIASALLCGGFLQSEFLLILVLVLFINIIYTFFLKRIPIIDVIAIGVLFLLRLVAGVVLITVKMFSPWLYLVTFMLSLYLGFGKRRSELAALTGNSSQTRPVLNGYSLELLDQLITIVSSVTIMAYSLYTFSGPTLPGNNFMMITIPIVIYGIFRYHYLIQIKHAGGAPEEVLLRDRPLQVTILIYLLAVCIGLYLY